MHFKQKLAYMALGSLFTLAGYLLASMVGDVTAQHEKAQALAFNQPKLSEVRSFTIYAKEGEFKKINLTDGKVVEQKPTNDFQNGELQVVLLGNEKALLIGNAGTAEVRVVQEKGSLSFIETTPSGNQHVLIIYDEWDRKEGGFRFTYTRNVVDNILLSATMRSTYKGIAKPDIGDVAAQDKRVEEKVEAIPEGIKAGQAQHEFNKNLKVTEFEAIRCKSLELVDRNGNVQGKIWVDGTWGKADFPLMTCENLRVVENWDKGAGGGNILAHLGYTDSNRQDILRVFNQKAVTAVPQLDNPNETVEIPITDDVVQIGADDTGGYVKVLPNIGKVQATKSGGVKIGTSWNHGEIVIEGIKGHTRFEGDVITLAASPDKGDFSGLHSPKTEIWNDLIVIHGKRGGFAKMEVRDDGYVFLRSNDYKGAVAIYTDSQKPGSDISGKSRRVGGIEISSGKARAAMVITEGGHGGIYTWDKEGRLTREVVLSK